MHRKLARAREIHVLKKWSDAPLLVILRGYLATNQETLARHGASLIFGMSIGERACQRSGLGSKTTDLGKSIVVCPTHRSYHATPRVKRIPRGSGAQFSIFSAALLHF